MIYGLYQSAAGMLTHEYRQDILANNIANAETPGFKREIAVFAERIPAREAGRRSGPSDPLLDHLTGGVWLGRTETDFGEGVLVKTDSPMDVALAGPGFFLVQKDGRQYLTRDGRMTQTPDGRLVAASDGAEYLGAAGQPLRVNPRGGEIRVDEDGRILQGPNRAVVSQLGIVDVTDYHQLSKAGAGRFTAPAYTPIPNGTRVQNGYIESSGVEPVKEMVTMIEASRAYQLNAQMLTLADQTAARLINATAA